MGKDIEVDTRDHDFFHDPSMWPHWPLLPIKRPRSDGAFPELGVVYDTGEKDKEGRPRLLLLAGANLLRVTGAEILAGQELKPNFILIEGWVVD